MFRVMSLEAMAWKNVEAASALALQSTRGEKASVTSSNDVKSEAFCGKIILKSGEWEHRLSDRRFEAQVVYAFTRIGSGRV